MAYPPTWEFVKQPSVFTWPMNAIDPVMRCQVCRGVFNFYDGHDSHSKITRGESMTRQEAMNSVDRFAKALNDLAGQGHTITLRSELAREMAGAFQILQLEMNTSITINHKLLLLNDERIALIDALKAKLVQVQEAANLKAAKTAPINAVMVRGNDWDGLFINGKLACEGHSLQYHEVSKALGVQLKEKQADPAWLDKETHFPENLKDVRFAQ
jgi:hypothetical protein